MVLLFKLLLSHLLGDFLLQPDSWVKAKEDRKLKSYQLYLHVFIHFLLIMILVFDLGFWKWALLIVIIHLGWDILKIYAQRNKTKRKWFFVDQSLHVLTILGVSAWSQHINISLPAFNNQYILLLLTMVYGLTQPTSIIIRSVISKWTPSDAQEGQESLENAGKYIGILERLFVFVFVIMGKWEAIGFLLASKSVFRFGDLKESKDRKLTEYVLIGTLLSFGIAIAAGIIFLKLNLISL
jgi:uncharacterized membrane protein